MDELQKRVDTLERQVTLLLKKVRAMEDDVCEEPGCDEEVVPYSCYCADHAREGEYEYGYSKPHREDDY